MSTLPEQFSEARRSQVAAQLELFRSFSSTAVESAEKVIALNLSTSRASVEQSAAAMRQLLEARDPRDLFSLTTQSQQQFESFLAYGRALFNIAAATRLPVPHGAAAPVLTRPPVSAAPEAAAAAAVAPEAPAPESATPEVQAGAPEAPTLDAAPTVAPEPAVEVIVEALPESIPESIAKTTLAEAISQVVTQEAAEKPVAAPLVETEPQPIEVSGIKPVDATPPAAATTTAAPTPAGKAGKGSRKK